MRRWRTRHSRKVYALLDGLSLEKAAVLADEIKGWDKKGVDDPRSFHYLARRNIDKQLRDFWRANQPTHDLIHPRLRPLVPTLMFGDAAPTIS